MEAPRNEGDTGVMSAVGTPMLKSVRVLMHGESEQQDAMGVTGKGATVPVRVRDRGMVVSDGTGARLPSAVKEEGWFERPMPDVVLLPGSRCSEHYTV
ncbi:hypothetical protein TIFTF001_040010 [Ficus carica]|uniref:Uncharacterized protein n=1 Tax=Ficus carica TaxID=3494 RepID=A0AA87Z378_FICCA|nr:hypothetical protein TIFTF001_039989 [Ficus carica]GMN20986.1 hypothetical protein TIFTF001_039998 [Ficus carica]GMN21016.1 hypothetical protein TIFTF001_040001 [Ficus carica]GMN21024.1 hypothetical protein TIFTF001_040010 [Ficus carica]